MRPKHALKKAQEKMLCRSTLTAYIKSEVHLLIVNAPHKEAEKERNSDPKVTQHDVSLCSLEIGCVTCNL